MKEIKVKSDFGGRVHLRDFEVQKCIDYNEPVKIKYGIDSMVLTPDELVSKRTYTSKDKYKSKIGGPDYFLYGYKWEPEEIDY
jgi:hypothetical protein